MAGRTESKQNPTAFIFYPIMQCADVFQLEVDICQLGMDQRKVNMFLQKSRKVKKYCSTNMRGMFFSGNELIDKVVRLTRAGEFDKALEVAERIWSGG